MKLKSIAALCLAAALVLIPLGSFGANAPQPAASSPSTAQTGQPSAVLNEKDEVVYATLSAQGQPSGVYIVNHFDVASAGSLTDYGAYDSVVNLTDTAALSLATDTVSFYAPAGDYYYQGNLSGGNLPWAFSLSYSIGGKTLSPAEAAGKTGRLALGISSRQNPAADPTFYGNYMLQITVTLNAAACRNIDAAGAAVANAGENKVITYTVLPGKDADFTLRADVTDFEMTGVSIAAVPYSMQMDFPDTDSQLDDLQQLPDAISDLNKGVAKLLQGSREISNGAGALANGSSGIQSGLAQLSGSSPRLTDASAAIANALSQIAASLASLPAVDLTQLTALPNGLTQLADGLSGVSSGLAQLKSGFSPAYAALDAAIAGIPAQTVTPEQIAALSAALSDPAQQAVVAELANTYSAAQTVKGTYAQVKGAFDAVASAVDSLSGAIDSISTTLRTTAASVNKSLQSFSGLNQLNALVSGLTELSANYSAFHAGFTEYANGVNTLYANYGSFQSGLAAFHNGTGELANGVSALYDGTNTLNEEVSSLPETLQKEIDSLKEQYLPADFDPVSFASVKNTGTSFVQFVFQCNGIKKAAPAAAPQSEPQPETFWDRLAALFTPKKAAE